MTQPPPWGRGAQWGPQAGGPPWGAPSGPGAQWGPPGAPPPAGGGFVGLAPKPGGIPLRPLGVGDLLGGAVEIAQRNPRAILGAGLVGALLGAAASVIPAYYDFAARRSAGPLPVNPSVRQALGELRRIMIGLLLSFPLTLIGTAAVAGLVAVTTMRDALGVRTSPAQAWAGCRRFLLPIMGATLLIGIGFGFGLLLLIVPGIVLYIRWYCAIPALVIEEIGVGSALGRSWNLVRGYFWRVLGLLLLAALLFGAITSLAGVLGTGLAEGLVGGTDPYADGATFPIGYHAVRTLPVLLVSTVVTPVASIYTVLIYIDLRFRQEGLDATLRAAHERSVATGQAPL